ncbi:MAG: HAD hydrolase-like protein [bacterium]|nr:HAD hydrolase-like protein [bacterium]
MSGRTLKQEKTEKYFVELKEYKKTKDYLVAIDTDGCIVDNMNGKQMLVFHPLYMEFYNLWDIESYFRETAEYFNLFSIHRGSNRFIALSLTLKELKKRSDVRKYAEKNKITIPEFDMIDRFISFCEKKGYGLSNVSLQKYLEINVFNFEIHKLLGWSKVVNDTLPFINKRFTPFKNVRKCLEDMVEAADIVVVSQTPYDDLYEYWKHWSMLDFLNFICSQEIGSKTQQIKMLKGCGYREQNILVIGDSFGDLEAARKNDVRFYPVIPGKEEESWENFPEVFDLFLNGRYSDEKQAEFVDEFSRFLPDSPPWVKKDYNHIDAYREKQKLRKSLYEDFNPGGRLLLL